MNKYFSSTKVWIAVLFLIIKTKPTSEGMIFIQRYYISPYKFSHSTVSGQDDDDQGFYLMDLARGEWDKLPDLLTENQQVIDKQRLEELHVCSTQNESTQHRTSSTVTIIPKVAHLGRNIHYVRYRDMDEQAEGRPIIFCLTPKSLILLEHAGVSLRQIERWAKRGVLHVPMDLANILALEVFFHHQQVLDSMEDRLYEVEEDILASPKIAHQRKIMLLHKQIMAIKKAINLHQMVLARLADIESSEKLDQELEQTTDRLLDNIQSVHDMVENLRDAYQTAVQNRTNDIMKVLTILATILLPINLLTSYFGMNFSNLPLITTSYGLTIFYIVSVVITVAALVYFKKKDWLFIWHRN